MIDLITIHQEREWRQIVLNSLDYDFYHTWQYHNLSKEGNPIMFKYSLGNDFIAFPLLKRNIPHSKFHDMTSVYGYSGPISNKAFENISCQMKDSFRREFCNFLSDNKIISVFSRLNPFIGHVPFMEKFEGVHDNGKIVVINLLESLEMQRSRYFSGLLRKINRLKRLGFYVRESKSPEAIKEFLDIYTENMKRVCATNFYMFTEEYFQNLLYSTDFHSKLILVYHENIVVCGEIIVFTQKVMHSHLLGTRTEYMRYSPAKLITDEISQMGRQLGMHYFNLGGGLGFKQDSLFNFKESFSDLSLDFKSWRYIADQKNYLKLIRDANIDPAIDVDFFPLYRYQNDQNSTSCVTDRTESNSEIPAQSSSAVDHRIQNITDQNSGVSRSA